MRNHALTGLASGVATLLAGTAAAQASGAYNPHDVLVSSDVLRSSLNTVGAPSYGSASYGVASDRVYSTTTGVLNSGYVSTGGQYASGTISAPISAQISGPMSGTFSGQITGTITGTITLNPVVQPAPVVTTYAAPAVTSYVAPAPIYTPPPAPIYTTTTYVEPAPIVTPYVPPPPPPPVVVPYTPPPVVVVPPPVVAPVADLCGPWGADRNIYGQLGAGYAYAGDDVDGLRLDGRGLDRNYHVMGGLGLRMRGQGVGCDDHFRVGLQNYYVRHDLRRGGQTVGGQPNRLRRDSMDSELIFATVEYAPDLGWGGVRPYVGAGIGAGGVNVGDGADGYDRDWNVAYKGVAGVTFEVNPKLDLYAEYNYVAVPGVTLKTGDGRRDGKIDYDAHLVNLGLRYNF